MAPVESHQLSVFYGALGVVAYETTRLLGDDGLLASEEGVIAHAAPTRRGHFAAGRRCARAGFEALGLPSQAILPGDDRRPLWPGDTEGSISHTDGLCVAIVSKRSSLDGRGIGVDVEQRGRVREAVFGKLFTEAELDVLAGLDDDERSLHATIGFSAKEAFYKAQYPITGAWVSFTDVAVEITPGGARAHRATDLAALDEVCWPVDLHVDVRDMLVVTGAVVAPAVSGRTS